MLDLIFGFSVIVIESFLLLGLIYRGCRGRSAWTLSIIAAGLVTLLLINSWFIYDTVLFAKWLPFSNVIILSNQIPVLLTGLAGVVLAMPKEKMRRWRKIAVTIFLILFGGYVSAKPVIIFSRPLSKSSWQDDVCLQTSDSSCSAACAATLLKHHGIKATEAEMIDLCLTNQKGTYSLGLIEGCA